jgi:hypothetical protein
MKNHKITENDMKNFYKAFFGTNKTNKDFYDIYAEESETTNGELYNNKIEIEGENGEYYYMPKENLPLTFYYKEKVEDGYKYGDYYIEAEAKDPTSGFEGGYSFKIKKTEHAKFPDRGFYVHFIHDRTYQVDRKTEEDDIINYMKKYQIIGTELHLLKPYFKTFDIIGTVNYNANYNASMVKKNVENALKNKYSIKNIEDIEIGNKIYRSEIFKTVMNIEGVESFELKYLGYDYTDQDTYPDQKYYIKSDIKNEVEFYICSVLADSTDEHGIIFEYNKVNNGTL